MRSSVSSSFALVSLRTVEALTGSFLLDSRDGARHDVHGPLAIITAGFIGAIALVARSTDKGLALNGR